MYTNENTELNGDGEKIKKVRTMQTEISDTFHSIKSSSLNFGKFVLANGTAFSEIHEHEDNLGRCIQIFGSILPEKIIF